MFCASSAAGVTDKNEPSTKDNSNQVTANDLLEQKGYVHLSASQKLQSSLNQQQIQPKTQYPPYQTPSNRPASTFRNNKTTTGSVHSTPYNSSNLVNSSTSNLLSPLALSKLTELQNKAKDFTALIQKYQDYEDGESVCCHYSSIITDEIGEEEVPRHSIILPYDYKESKLSQEKHSFESLHTVRNIDTGEEFDIRQPKQIEKVFSRPLSLRSSANWKNWWQKKKEIEHEFAKACTLNLTEQIISVFTQAEKDLLPNLNKPLKDDGWTALHFAAFYGNTLIMNLYLKQEVELDSLNNLGQTPLIVSCIENKQEVASLLIDLGANINIQDVYLNTPLHYCFLNGDKNLMDVILRKQNLNVSLRNTNGKLAYEECQDPDLVLYYKLQENKKHEQRKIMMNIFDGSNSNIQKAPPVPMLAFRQDTSTLNTKQPSMINITSNYQAKETVVYSIEGLLGKGAFGEVYLVRNKQTNDQFALKLLHKQQILEQDLVKYAVAEKNILQVMKHPFIVKLNKAFQTNDKLFFILENGAKGDILQHLRMETKFSEAKARFYAAETLLALDYLHRMDIIYRDLKSQNILIGEDGHVLLSDFGLSKEGITQQDTGTNSFCGSVSYMPPEVIKNQGHGKSIDIYLLGLFIYEMLTGQTPYNGKDEDAIYNNISTGTLKFPSYVSRTAKSLLVKLLQKEPRFRPSSDQIKRHPFFSGINWKDLEQKKIEPPRPTISKQQLFSTENCVFNEGDQIEVASEETASFQIEKEKQLFFHKWSFVSIHH